MFYRIVNFFASKFGALEVRLRQAKYNKQNDKFRIEDVTPIERDEFFDFNLITHAGGGHGLAYINSLDTFDYYYSHGNRVFEYDVIRLGDGEYALSHEDFSGNKEEFLSKETDYRFSTALLGSLLDLVKTHTDIKVILDSKFKDLTDLAKYIKDYLKEEQFLDRIVIQVFKRENIEQVRSVYDYRMLFVCMFSSDTNEIAKICVEKGIKAVSVSKECIDNFVFYKAILNANVPIFCYTVNTVKGYKLLKNKGIQGVFSDYLTQEDLDKYGKD